LAYAGEWDSSNHKKKQQKAMNEWSGYQAETTTNRRKSLPNRLDDNADENKMSSRRRLSFGEYSTAWEAETARTPRKSVAESPLKRRPRKSLTESPAIERTPRKSQTGTPNADMDRKSRKSFTGTPNADTERKSRRSLTGTPTAAKWVQKHPGGVDPSMAPSLATIFQPKLTQKHLDKELATWMQRNGHQAADAKVVSLCDSNCSAGGRLATVMLRGNVFLIDLQAPEGSAKYVVVDAQTRSAWPALKQSITSALEGALKRPFAEFIHALWNALPVDEGPEAKHSQHPVAVEIKQTFRAEDVTVTGYAEDSFVEDSVPCTIGLDQAQSLPDKSRARSFCQWLNNRKPLWRLNPGNENISWDFPLSKCEKREYLFLSVSADRDEISQENLNLKEEVAECWNEFEYQNQVLMEKNQDEQVPESEHY